MNGKTRFGLTLLALGMLILTAACELNSVEEVKSDPFKFQNKQARLGGIVRQNWSVLKYGVYEIEDQTGKIFIVSEKGAPSKGAVVEVKGNTRTAFNLSGIDYGTVIMENKRKVRK